MQIYQCLDKEAKTTGRVFLTASAGTGKTFAIEHIVVRKILDGIAIDEILVVTFTREATRSLRRRIHENLCQVLEILQKNIPLKEHGLAYLEDLTIDEAKKRASRALSNLDQGQIFTIHGFCLDMLKKYSVKESLSLSSLSVNSTSQSDELIHQEIFSLLRKADLLDFSLVQKNLFIEQTKKDLHKLVKVLKPILFGSVPLKETRSFSDLKGLMPDVDLKVDLLLSDLEVLKMHFKGLASQAGKIHKSYIDQIVALKQGRFDDLLTAKTSLFSLITDENRKKNYALKREDLHYYTLFFEKGTKILELIQEGSSIENLNHRFCFLMKEHFDKNDALFFADKLLTRMSKALDDPSFFRHIRSAYKAVIVDEFQDTDETQYSIFKRLFSDRKDLFFCVVGDEKQSIYAFRGAHLDTFEQAKDDFLDNHYKLDANYRSSKGIIQGLEALFCDFKCLDDQDIAFDFQKVKAFSKGVKCLDPSLEFFVEEKEQETKIYAAIYSRIEQLKNEFELKDSSFAFLVKDRFQAARIYNYLKEQGCSVDALVKESLFDTRAFFWAMLLLDLFDQNTLATKKALLVHPLVGHNVALFQDGQENQAIYKAFEALDSVIEVFHEKGLNAGFCSVLDACIFCEDVSFEESLVARDMIQDFFALKKVMQFIVRESLERALSIKDLKVHLKKIIRENREDIASLKDVSSSSDSMVIMTSHASKGLEFDVVIPIGLILETKGKKKLSLQEAVEIDREKMRLFYVALTRAKQKLLIPCTFSNKKRNIAQGNASCMDLYFARKQGPCTYRELYQRVQESSKEQILKELEAFFVHGNEPMHFIHTKKQAPLLHKPKPFLGLQYERKMHSFSSLYKKQQLLHFEDLEDDIEGGRLFGTLMHKILQHCVSKGLHHPFNEEKILELLERYLKFTPMKKQILRIFEMVKNTFFTPIEQGLCLADITKKQIHLEAEFLMHSSENHDLKGFVDLLFIHNKNLYILDYKTHQLPNYKKETLQKIIEHYQYDSQLMLYKKAAQRFVNTHKLDIEHIKAYLLFVRGKSALIRVE